MNQRMDSTLADILETLKDLLVELELPEVEVKPDMSLIASGLISSMDCLALLLDLEAKNYSVHEIHPRRVGEAAY